MADIVPKEKFIGSLKIPTQKCVSADSEQPQCPITPSEYHLRLPEIVSGYLVSAVGSPARLPTKSADPWIDSHAYYLTKFVAIISTLPWFKTNLFCYFTVHLLDKKSGSEFE